MECMVMMMMLYLGGWKWFRLETYFDRGQNQIKGIDPNQAYFAADKGVTVVLIKIVVDNGGRRTAAPNQIDRTELVMVMPFARLLLHQFRCWRYVAIGAIYTIGGWRRKFHWTGIIIWIIVAGAEGRLLYCKHKWRSNRLNTAAVLNERPTSARQRLAFSSAFRRKPNTQMSVGYPLNNIRYLVKLSFRWII